MVCTEIKISDLICINLFIKQGDSLSHVFTILGDDGNPLPGLGGYQIYGVVKDPLGIILTHFRMADGDITVNDADSQFTIIKNISETELWPPGLYIIEFTLRRTSDNNVHIRYIGTLEVSGHLREELLYNDIPSGEPFPLTFPITLA